MGDSSQSFYKIKVTPLKKLTEKLNFIRRKNKSTNQSCSESIGDQTEDKDEIATPEFRRTLFHKKVAPKDEFLDFSISSQNDFHDSVIKRVDETLLIFTVTPLSRFFNYPKWP